MVCDSKRFNPWVKLDIWSQLKEDRFPKVKKKKKYDPEYGQRLGTQKDSAFLNTQFRESNREGEGEVAKETAHQLLQNGRTNV